MIINKKALPRRTFLRGMGVTVALPLLDAMVPALTDLNGGSGPVFYTFKVRAEDVPLVLPPRDGEHLKERFRTALLGGEPGESRRTEN